MNAARGKHNRVNVETAVASDDRWSDLRLVGREIACREQSTVLAHILGDFAGDFAPIEVIRAGARELPKRRGIGSLAYERAGEQEFSTGCKDRGTLFVRFDALEPADVTGFGNFDPAIVDFP